MQTLVAVQGNNFDLIVTMLQSGILPSDASLVVPAATAFKKLQQTPKQSWKLTKEQAADFAKLVVHDDLALDYLLKTTRKFDMIVLDWDCGLQGCDWAKPKLDVYQLFERNLLNDHAHVMMSWTAATHQAATAELSDAVSWLPQVAKKFKWIATCDKTTVHGACVVVGFTVSRDLNMKSSVRG